MASRITFETCAMFCGSIPNRSRSELFFIRSPDK
jgi:hypothetical protein